MKHYLPNLRCFEGRFHEPPDPSDIGLGHHPFNGISDQRSEAGAVFYIPSALWHACVDAVSRKVQSLDDF